MVYGQKSYAVLLAICCISSSYASKDADSDRVAYKKLALRVQALEIAMGLDECEDVEKRLVVEKIEHFIAELKALRKDCFAKLKSVRKEIKIHAGDISKIKREFKAVSQALGSPVILQTIGFGAKTVFAFIVELSNRIASIEAAIKESHSVADSSAESSDPEITVSESMIA